MIVRKKIFVTGATGNQGGAVVRNLLSKGFYVKALVRKPAAAKLSPQDSLEIIKGDLNDPASYCSHLKNVDGVFCNLVYKYGIDKEIKQGIELVNASKENNIEHFVYSSVIGCDLNTGIPHWDSKLKIEDYLNASGMSYTILRPASLYENMLIPQVKSRILKGKLMLPTQKNTVQQFISSEDIGKIAALIFSDLEKYRGRTITLAAEQMNGEQLASTFSKAMGREIRFQQLPMFITRLVMGRDLTKMFRWVNNNDACFVKDMQALQNEFPGMLSLEEWIRMNFK
ncbi:MAG TPA: NmrA/HSCARG family protein [Chitinophagaceae bacterium]|nr:NmrA/HSCARG family protein [Chitinophagaceae bacterium]